MKSSSSAKASGSRARSLRGVSVVPRMTLPSQGTANSTRPSAVLGTSSAWSEGRKSRSTTTCTPWLGATMGLTGLQLGILLAEQIHPGAGGIDHATRRTVKRRPVSASSQTTPATLPASCTSSLAGQ
jgi:hypothetical protein